jgi:hypothetical protein
MLARTPKKTAPEETAPAKPAAKKTAAKTADKPAAKKTAAKKPATRKPAKSKASGPELELGFEKAQAAPVIEMHVIATRAYFIAERRQKMGWSGDSSSDWIEAESQILAEMRRR